MAEKVGGRWQEGILESEGSGSGIQVTFTRKGVEVFGFYDHFVGLPGPNVSWEELDAIRARVMEGRPKAD